MTQQLELPGLDSAADDGDVELTDWHDGPPPMVGWWDTRLRGSDTIVVRRFWRGGPRMAASEEAGFSRWSYPAENLRMPSFQAYLARTNPSYINEDLVQWRGRRYPEPLGNYPYQLQQDRYIRQRMRVAMDLLRIRVRVVV